jgi:PAS domain S-box-containing protein
MAGKEDLDLAMKDDFQHSAPPWNEGKRLAALRRTQILDTPPEPAFDDIAALAAKVCQAPMAMITFIDADRQWFKAEFGLELHEFGLGNHETPLDVSICADALRQPGVVVIPDLRQDYRFNCNPLVVTGPKLRFYAGAPLLTPDGLPLGALCVIDRAPRPHGLSEDQIFTLEVLARQIMSQLELNRAIDERASAIGDLRESEAHYRQILDSAIDFGIITMDLSGRVTSWNQGAACILGWSEEEMLGQTVDRILTREEGARGLFTIELSDAWAWGRGTGERWLRRKDGTLFWASCELMPLAGEDNVPRGFLEIFRDSTAARRSEEALRISEEQLQLALTASAFVGAWDWDVRKDRLVADPRFANLYGIDAARMAEGVPIAEFSAVIHPHDQVAVDTAIERALAETSAFAEEYRLVPADGSIHWVLTRGHVYRDEAGAPLRFSGITVDITDRKRAEAAERENNLRLRLAVSATDIGTWDYDVPTRVLQWDDRCKALFGLNREAEVSYDGAFLRALHPDDRAAVAAAAARVLNASEPSIFSAEYRAIGLDDNIERWISAMGSTIVENGRTVRFIGTVMDITDRKRAEDVLRSANERLEAAVVERTLELTAEIAQRKRSEADIAALYAKTPIVLHSLDHEGCLLTVSDRWLEFMGYVSRDEVLGRPITDFMTPETTADHLAIYWPKLQAEGGLRDVECRFVKKTGEVADVLLSARIERDEQGCFLRKMAALVDVTQHRRAEEALRQSQKMEAVGQLTGGIAHDFNNLLTGVIGNLDLLQRRIAAGRFDESQKYVDAVMNAATRASSLTHRLLAFARRQSLDVQPVDLNALIVSLEDLIRRTMGETIALRSRLDPGLWRAITDANQFENAILNLVINARDAMPSGGDLTIETTNCHLDLSAASALDGLEPGDYVVTCVRDTGSGMAPEVIAKAFDPFFTTKPIGQGTGLGLSMIYGFAKQSGGHVHIDSEKGKGTSVRLYLPRHRGGEPELDNFLRGGVTPQARHGETVLLVEDDVTVRMLVFEVLHDLGYSAIEASDSAAALPILASEQRLDLLVTDVGLPGINGRELADLARRTRPDLKVLFVTGYAEGAAVRGGFLEPGMEMITKPFALDVLAQRIRGMIEPG